MPKSVSKMDTTSATCTKEKLNRCFQYDNSGIEPESRREIGHEFRDGYDSSESVETASDEIPVFIHGEQRWISGVNEETTCGDLVNVLLTDEGIPIGASLAKNYVITERWRRVEQILDDDTKIQQIWSAWGQAKSEVKLTLRQLGGTDPIFNRCTKSTNDQDSGMGSPNGSTNSAIIRRRRHRASKSTTAWVTHAQTIHPKSQKATIEKLVKLILEQGETIQHQLAKLRDREFEIAKIEEERHKVREREHGKNYLLETYLNGLHEAEEKELITVNSDSGVQTEGAASSPEISSCIQEVEDFDKDEKTYQSYRGYKEKKSYREQHLLEEHKHTKEFSSLLTECKADHERDVEDISAKIEWMEKLIVINKHLQREEELLVRLGAKIRKYESQDPALNEKQVRDALVRVNVGIESSNNEIRRIEHELLIAQDVLHEKTQLLEDLNIELLDTITLTPNNIITPSSATNTPVDMLESEVALPGLAQGSIQITGGVDSLPICCIPPPPTFAAGYSVTSDVALPETKTNLNASDLAGNLYSFSQYISKPNYDFNEINENRDQKVAPSGCHSVPTKTELLNGGGPTPRMESSLKVLKVISNGPTNPNVGILKKHSTANGLPTANISKCVQHPATILASVNSIQKPDPVNLNANVYATTFKGNGKLGPKKLISGICNEMESNSDTGLSSLEDDIVHLGTLV